MEKPYSVIDCAQVPTLLHESDTLLLDCRKLTDYRTGHIDGALHVHDGLVESLLTNGDRERTLVIYCCHGHTSEHLAEALGNAGFARVFSVAGGYNEDNLPSKVTFASRGSNEDASFAA